MKGQRGIALPLVLIFLAMGAVVLGPTLNHAGSALKFHSVSRDNMWVRYALRAITQQALWELQYDTQFKDCDTPPDGTVESFADCVALWGSWTLATPGKLKGVFNEIPVEPVNGKGISVTVKVPGALSAPPPPPPTPSPGTCFYPSVTRDTDLDKPGTQTWARVGEPITYTLGIFNCSSSMAQKDIRKVVVLLHSSFDFVSGSTGGNLATPPLPPEVTRCDGPTTPPNPDYFGCLAQDNSQLLTWPSGTRSFGQSPYPAVKLSSGEGRTLTFQATTTTWGIFYVDVVLCYFAAADPCGGSQWSRTAAVAPVIVGVFDIEGMGTGYSFLASSYQDSGGSGIFSMQPQ